MPLGMTILAPTLGFAFFVARIQNSQHAITALTLARVASKEAYRTGNEHALRSIVDAFCLKKRLIKFRTASRHGRDRPDEEQTLRRCSAFYPV